MKSKDSTLSSELHAPTVRAMLDLLTVDSGDRGFYYNEANNYGVVRLQWWTGKGDPFKRFADASLTSTYRTPDGGTEIRPNGRYILNSKAVSALMREMKSRQKHREKLAQKPKKR